MSHVSMIMGSVSVDDTDCELFLANTSALLAIAFATIATVSTRGGQKGSTLSTYQRCGAFHMMMLLEP